MSGFRLHNFFRSSTSFRVRAALNLKRVSYDYIAYALRAGEHQGAEHLELNPQGLVPTLETPDGPLSQSLAIIEWLDETKPEPPLLPKDPWARARVRSLAHAIALDIHPVNNLRVLLILDEATEGLAPLVRKTIWDALEKLRSQGLTIVVVDKNLDQLIPLADRCVVLERGEVAWTGNRTKAEVERTRIEQLISVH